MKQQKSQSGFAHLMIITVILALVIIGLVSYIVWQNLNNKAIDSSNVQQETSQKDVTKEYYIAETDTNITFPSAYSVEVNPRESWSESYKYYEFIRNPYADVSFGGIMFSNKESIKSHYDFVNNGEFHLIEGNYFRPDDFSGLENAFRNGTGYEYKPTDELDDKNLTYENININGQNWLVATHDGSARKQGYGREYIRFVDGGDTMMSAGIAMTSLDNSAADELFSQFKLTR